MAMSHSTIWWLLAGVAIALELLSGTVYLLLIAFGLAAAAVSAHLGAGVPAQLVVAAVVGAGTVAVWYLRQRRRAPRPPTSADPAMNMDVGETVQVEAWQPDGTATVRYRGAQWTVVARTGNLPSTGAHRVVEVVGNRLVVDKI